MIKHVGSQRDLPPQVGKRMVRVEGLVHADVPAGRAGPSAGQIAGPAPGLGEKNLRLVEASVQAMSSQDQHGTRGKGTASELACLPQSPGHQADSLLSQGSRAWRALLSL